MMFLALFIYICTVVVVIADLELPQSFSVTHRRQRLPVSISDTGLSSAVSTYQLDTHVEVVFLGDSIASSNDELGSYFKLLSTSLDHLASLSVDASPSRFTHEKFIYHVSLSAELSKNVEQILKGDVPVSPSNIEALLLDYTRRTGLATTLFILNFRQLAMQRKYAYHTPSSDPFGPKRYQETGVSECPQQAFVHLGTEGVAWFDIQAGKGTLGPSGDSGTMGRRPHLVPTDLHLDGGAMPDIHRMASFIHRSMETLVPLPTLHRTDTRPSDSVHFVVITICVREKQACVDDPDAITAVQAIARSFDNSAFFTFEGVPLSAIDHPAVLHAISAAALPSENNKESSHLSANVLAQWLSTASVIQEPIMREGGVGQGRVHIVPLLIISTDDNISGLEINDNNVSIVTTVRLQLTGQAASNVGWETSGSESGLDAVIALHTVDPEIADTGVSCDGKKVNARGGFFGAQVRSAVMGILWGDCTSPNHYSSSERGIVEDYTWSGIAGALSARAITPTTPTAETKSENGFSFIALRCVARHNIFGWSEVLQARLATSLASASAIVPPIDTLAVLGELSIDSAPSNSFRQQAEKPKKAKSSESSREKTPRFLTNYLDEMDNAASEFSHMDFDATLMHLHNAEIAVGLIEGRIEQVSRNRMGRLMCADEVQLENPDITENKFEEGSIINQDVYGVATIPLLFISLLGIVLGYVSVGRRKK